MTHRQRLSELDDLTDALRDGTDELDRRLKAVLSYLKTSGGGGARAFAHVDGPRSSGRTTSTPVGGPAA